MKLSGYRRGPETISISTEGVVVNQSLQNAH